jgi:uncharacterized protein (DUF2164 family)
VTIRLQNQTEADLVASIKRFFAEELDEDIGDLKARTLLDYCLQEIGPSVYNQAIADAQQSLELAVADLSGVRYEPEFGYWKKRRPGH